jgi:hypothetical protein
MQKVLSLIALSILLMGTKCGRHIFVQSYETKNCFDNSIVKPTGELSPADFYMLDKDIKISEARIAKTTCSEIHSPLAKLSANIVTQCYSISYKMKDPKNIWGAVYDAIGSFAVATLPIDDPGKMPNKIVIVDSTGGPVPSKEIMVKVFEQNEKFLVTGIFGESCLIPLGDSRVVTQDELLDLFEVKK